MIDRYIGIPFEDKGRSFSSCDCYGLVKLYYKHELNIDIPETKITADKPRRIMINYLNEISKNWIEVDTPKKDCVVAMCMNEEHPKLVTHFAVMIDDKRLLHTLNKRMSHITTLSHMEIKPFIKGFYRWHN